MKQHNITLIIRADSYMKRIQLVLKFALVILIYLLPVSIQQSASAAERILPRISFEKTVYDLGNVGQGTKSSCEFRFTNTGQTLLKIGKISRTCGCTVFQLDKKEYPPNTKSLKINPWKKVRISPWKKVCVSPCPLSNLRLKICEIRG